MEEIDKILTGLAVAHQALADEAGPLRDGELLSLYMNTVSVISEVSNACKAQQPKVFPRT